MKRKSITLLIRRVEAATAGRVLLKVDQQQDMGTADDVQTIEFLMTQDGWDALGPLTIGDKLTLSFPVK